jgi:hypothetical protein
MADASDASLWPVVVGGLLAIAGGLVGVVATAIRDAAQTRHEKQKRRADKFEELVAAVYEFDHWVDSCRLRDVSGEDIPPSVSPFARIQSISSVYFPKFDAALKELDAATSQYRLWMTGAAQRRIAGDITNRNDGFVDAYRPYSLKRDGLVDALKKFAHEEFQ